MTLEDLGSVFHDDEATYVVCKRFMYTIRENETENGTLITVGGTGFTYLGDDDYDNIVRIVEFYESDDVEVRDGVLWAYNPVFYSDRDGNHDTGWAFWDCDRDKWVYIYKNNEGEEVHY